MASLNLQVPSKAVGSIIGRGGSVIKGLQTSFHVDVDIDRDSNSVKVTGSPEGVASCHEEIQRILGHQVTEEPLAIARLAIETSFYSRLIGRGGSTLKGLQQSHGCYIDIPGRGEDGPVVVEGCPSAVAAAIDEIRDIVGAPFDIETSNVDIPETETLSLDLESGEIQEALFFPGDDSKFDRFVTYLSSATRTLDVCVFTISDDRISNVLLTKHAQGVAVRIISDNDTAENQGSDVNRLRDSGVPTRFDASPAHMHHKFAVLDNKVLINGSFNWTRSAASQNNENMVITNTPGLVQQFSGHFDKLWEQFQ